MISAIHYAREHRVPYFGICLGMQMAVVEFARCALGWRDANSTEFDPAVSHPVIDLMPDQTNVTDMGGTMRLGRYPWLPEPGPVRRGGDLRAPPPPLRVQQRLPGGPSGGGPDPGRHIPRRAAGGGGGAAGPPLVCGGPVSPGVQKPTGPAAPAVLRIYQSGAGASWPGGRGRHGPRGSGGSTEKLPPGTPRRERSRGQSARVLAKTALRARFKKHQKGRFL